MKISKITLIFIGAVTTFFVAAQNPGELDTSFDPDQGPNKDIYAIAIQNDGKIIIGGHSYFTYYSGVPRNGVARINQDGTIDRTFNPGTGVDSTGAIRQIIIQNDDKIIITGGFTSYGGISRNRIARLNKDGSLDTSFNPGTGTDKVIWRSTLQSDGKIIIVGWFSKYNGTSRNFIARINADGSLDTTFNPGSGANFKIDDAVIQADGKIIIGGYFEYYNGISANQLARLNPDGSLDTTFDSGTGCDGADISNLTIQCDGKIIANGWFTSYNGTPINQIARINPDGSLDTTFNPGTSVDGSNTIIDVKIQCDAKYLIVGYFTTYNGDTVNGIARLNPDGYRDTTFNPIGTGAGTDYPFIEAIDFQPDGKAVIVGWFDSYNNVPRNRIARIYECEFSSYWPPVTACNRYTWPVNNITYTTSGVYDTVKTNAAGCTNVLKSLNLTINYPTNSSDTITACKNYTWNNTIYTQSGAYTDTILNVAGCDSIMSLNLAIADTGYSFSDTACIEYEWNNNLYSVSGTYVDSLTNVYGCDSIVTVNLIINIVDTSVTLDSISLTASADSATYQWLICDSIFIPLSGENDKTFSATANGNYAVAITQNGCTDTSACYNVTGIGIDETNYSILFKIYPNPFSETTTFYFNDEKKASTLTIYNLLGFVVERKNIFSETTYTFNRKDISSGVYFYKIEDKGAFIASGKLLVF